MDKIAQFVFPTLLKYSVKNCGLHRHSNLDRRSRMSDCWPPDHHHHHGRCPMQSYYSTHHSFQSMSSYLVNNGQKQSSIRSVKFGEKLLNIQIDTDRRWRLQFVSLFVSLSNCLPNYLFAGLYLLLPYQFSSESLMYLRRDSAVLSRLKSRELTERNKLKCFKLVVTSISSF